MSSLLDIIRGSTQAAAGQPAPLTDETQRAQGLLRAKTGKAVGTASDTATSNIGEQAAVAGTQAQLGQVQQQAATTQAATDIQQRRIEQEGEQQRAQVAQARRFQTVENNMRTQALLSELARDKDTLSLEKDGAKLEQTAFLLSMQDSGYVDKLQDIGRRKRLDDEAAFQAELERIAFGDSLSLLKQKLAGKDLLATGDREFREVLADISLDEAVRIAEIERADVEGAASTERGLLETDFDSAAAQAGITARAQGLSGIISGSLQAADAYAAGSEKTGDKTTPAPGKNTQALNINPKGK